MNSCIFCDIQTPVLQNEAGYAIYDSYPVSPGHMLIIPKQHIPNFFAADPPTRTALFLLVD